MRFSTILSSALLVGFVAAAPTNEKMDMSACVHSLFACMPDLDTNCIATEQF